MATIGLHLLFGSITQRTTVVATKPEGTTPGSRPPLAYSPVNSTPTPSSGQRS